MDTNSSICRLCLSDNAVVKIFGKKPSNVLDMIKKCCQFEIFEEDNLPQKLCLKCLNTLKICHEFVLQCVENNKKLLQNKDIKTDTVKIEQKYLIKSEPGLEFDLEIYDNNPNESYYDNEDHINDDHQQMDDIKPIINKQETLNNSRRKKRNRKTIKNKINKENTKQLKGKKIKEKKIRNESIKGLMKTVEKSEKILCDLCGRAVNRTHMKDHLRVHSTDENFPCELCPKKFKVRGNLMKHVKSMHRDTRVVCDICKKVYCSRDYLKSHIALVHSVEKRFTCDICNSAFKLKFLLDKHKRSHTQERPYQCRHCDSCFTLSSSRLDHERLHMGITPYKCPTCPKAFTQLSNMKSHFKHNHKDLVFKEVYKPEPRGKKLLIDNYQTDLPSKEVTEVGTNS